MDRRAWWAPVHGLAGSHITERLNNDNIVMVSATINMHQPYVPV